MKKFALLSVSAAAIAFASPASAADWSFGGFVSGFFGAADSDAEDRENQLGADARVRMFGSTVFSNGLEVGVGATGVYDEDTEIRSWAGGRLSGNLVGGRGAAFGPNRDLNISEARLHALGGFGELIFGRDDGVADMLAIAAPNIFTALAVNDWGSDATGLIDVHTINDFSGYAAKMTYMTPLFAGAKIGVSFTPELKDCVDTICFTPQRAYLAQGDPQFSLINQAHWEDIMEVALYYEHAFGNGLAIGIGGSFVTAEEQSGVLPELFSDYEAYAVGANLAFGGFTVGGSFRNSNGGYSSSDDEYVAFDAGITYETGPWGFMVGYGNSDAGRDAANPLDPTLYRQTQAYQTGVTYMLGAGISIGVAGQYVLSEKPSIIGGEEEATAIVFESSINF